MDDYLIRPMEPRDTERVLGIISRTDELDEEEAREFFRCYFDETEPYQGGGTHYVIECCEEHELVAVGGYLGNTSAKRCWLGFLFVDPYYQGQGLGTQLLRKIEEDIRENGMDHLLAPLEPSDIPTQVVRFYEVNGFMPCTEKIVPPVMNRPKTIIYRKALL